MPKADPPLPEPLVALFQRNAYVRQPNGARREREKSNYKKGWEVRLVLRNEGEVALAQRLIAGSGLKAGRPFSKARQWVIPFYGRKTLENIAATVHLKSAES